MKFENEVECGLRRLIKEVGTCRSFAEVQHVNILKVLVVNCAD